MMSSKEKTVHKQMFQNAQQTVEVIIKAKPKSKLHLKTKGKPKIRPNFNRDCLLKKELEKLSMETENKKLNSFPKKTGTCVPENYISKKTKKKQKSPPYEQYRGIKQKTSNPSGKHVLPSNTSWREFLQSHSSTMLSETQSHTGTSDVSFNLPEGVRVSEKSTKTKKTLQNGINALKPNEERVFTDQRGKDPGSYSDSSRDGYRNRSQPKDKISRPVQTSLQAETENIYKTYSIGNKYGPVPEPVDTDVRFSNINNQAKSSIDQTYSPFGESALRLLHQLRERLQTMGDCEGTNIVSAIEAYFGYSENKSSNRDALGSKSYDSRFFPPVFPTPNVAPPKDLEGEKLKRVIEEQEKKIKDQDKTIEELRALSAKLLAYHEQLTDQVIQSVKAAPNDNPTREESKGVRGKGDQDSGYEASSSEDLQRTVKLLTSERDALLKEVKSQREVILDLEVKLSRSSNEMKSHEFAVSSRPGSRDSQTAVDVNVGGGVRKGYAKPEELSSARPNQNYLLHHTSSDSNAESGSERGSSKAFKAPLNTPLHSHGNQQEQGLQPPIGTKNSTQPIIRTHETAENLVPDQGLSELVSSYKSSKHSAPISHPPTTLSNYASLTGDINQISSYEWTKQAEAPKVSPLEDSAILTLVSDLSTDGARPGSLSMRELSAGVAGGGTRTTLFSTKFSETPMLEPGERYLESTHLHERAKTSSSPSKPLRRRLDLQLSALDSSSENQVQLALEPCSVTDVSVDQ